MQNTHTTQEILASWRQLRADISHLPVEQQVHAVAEFIAPIPYGARTVDYHSPADWPTPWEILAHRQFCTSSISILAYHTLSMVSDAVLSLDLVDDGNDVYLVPIADNMVINFYPSVLVHRAELSKKASIIRSYSMADIAPVR